MKAMNGRIVAIVILALWLLTACAPDPRRDAAAYERRVLADSQAATEKLNREITAKKEAERAAKAEWNQAVWDESLGMAKTVGKVFVAVNGLVLMVAVGIVIGYGSWTIKETVNGLGQAVVLKAATQAALIHMDKGTRTFPIFQYHALNGTVFARNFMTGETVRLDSPQSANPQLIAALGQAMALGVAMQEMKGAKDASSMAVFQPDVIEMSDGKILVGKMIGDTVQFLKGADNEI